MMALRPCAIACACVLIAVEEIAEIKTLWSVPSDSVQGAKSAKRPLSLRGRNDDPEPGVEGVGDGPNMPKTPVDIIYWGDRESWGAWGALDCPRSQCRILDNRSALHEPNTRGLLWQGSSFDIGSLPLPRAHRHEWIVYNRESPCNYHDLMSDQVLSLFNMTASIAQTADWQVLPVDFNEVSIRTGGDIKQLYTELPAMPIAEKNKHRRSGIAPAVYIQQHCDADSGRDQFVKELMQHMDVDCLGGCLNNKPMPPEYPWATLHSDGFAQFLGRYKFSLAFENCECEDYVTEKFFRPVRAGSVPVYRGASNVGLWAPDAHSVIRVDDFATPKALAEHLTALDKNDTAYMEYLRFKQTGHHPAGTGGGVTNPALVALSERAMADVAAVRAAPEAEQDRRHMPDEHCGLCRLCDALARHAEQDPTGERFTSGDPAWMAKGRVLGHEALMPCAPAREEGRERSRGVLGRGAGREARAVHEAIWATRAAAAAALL